MTRSSLKELSEGIDYLSWGSAGGMLINRTPNVVYNSATYVSFVPLTAFIYGGAAYNNAGAINDGFAFYDYLEAGKTYSLDLLYGTFTASAKITCDISYDNGITWLTLDSARDTYAAAAGNVSATITGIIPPVSGRCLLRFRALAKNASSSAYFMYLIQARLRRTV